MLCLRKFSLADADIILGWINNECEFRMWSADRFDGSPLSPDDMFAHYDECCKSGVFFPLTAIDEKNNIVGHLILRYTNTDKTVARIGFVIVDNSVRNIGTGRKMLSLAKDYAIRNLRAKKLSLGVFENNIAARKCYKAVGFSELEIIDKFYNVLGEKWRCIDMELDI